MAHRMNTNLLIEYFRKHGEVVVKFTSISYPFNEYVGCWVGTEEAENGSGGYEIMLELQPIKNFEEKTEGSVIAINQEFKNYEAASAWVCEQLVALLPYHKS